MKTTDDIVARGGWFKREIRFKPLHLLCGATALGSGMYTGVIGSIAAFVWFHDRVVPDAFLFRSSVIGTVATIFLIVLTLFVGRREKERKVAVPEANQNTDPRCLY
jgi:hypothetical protein